MLEEIKKMARYVAVGAVSAVVDFGSYFLFTRFLGLSPDPGNVAAYCVGNVVSFFGHHFFTFEEKGTKHIFREYAKFVAVTLLGLGVSQAVVVSSIAIGIPDLVGKAAAVLVSGLFNFILNSVWTFRPRAKTPAK
jgi:putative flippase GtrA